MFRTEYEFELPMGYLEESGTLHKRGTMRLATAGDEILPQRDPRCQENPAYLIVILLSRVVTRLGTLSDGQVTPKVIEGLFRADLAYLQEFYNRINSVGKAAVPVRCPRCEHTFEAGLDPAGG
jgi:hypothetical protein